MQKFDVPPVHRKESTESNHFCFYRRSRLRSTPERPHIHSDEGRHELKDGNNETTFKLHSPFKTHTHLHTVQKASMPTRGNKTDPLLGCKPLSIDAPVETLTRQSSLGCKVAKAEEDLQRKRLRATDGVLEFTIMRMAFQICACTEVYRGYEPVSKSAPVNISTLIYKKTQKNLQVVISKTSEPLSAEKDRKKIPD